jgi:hypothetical protein
LKLDPKDQRANLGPPVLRVLLGQKDQLVQRESKDRLARLARLGYKDHLDRMVRKDRLDRLARLERQALQD